MYFRAVRAASLTSARPHTHRWRLSLLHYRTWWIRNQPGSLTSLLIVKRFGVIRVDSLGVALYAPAKQPRCRSYCLCSPRRYALIMRSKVRLNRSAWPLPRGFLTLVLVFRTSNIRHNSWNTLFSYVIPWSLCMDREQPHLEITSLRSLVAQTSAVMSLVGTISTFLVK